MGRIKDTDIYNFDEFLSLDDYLIGTDADSSNGKTRNYKLGNIFATFKSALQLTSLEFTFSDGSDPDLDETDPAYFTANDTNAGAITSLLVNKQAMSGADISVLVDMVAENVSSFMVRLNKPSAASEIFYFQIVSITDLITHYSIIVTNFVGGETLVDGTTYGLVFDLAGVPSIFNETDPVFLASDAAAVTAAKILNWDTAFTWGNHASVGYLTSETDPVFAASAASTILLGDIANWDAAYSYGDHAVAGYITSESDPTVGAHIKAISTGNINNWNLAYGWGDHSLVGYLTAETDAVFLASDAADITELDKTNWTSAFLWGDHALFGYLREINIDTLAELNGIVTDATLIDTTDSRLSDARTPLAHSHVEADISDLQSYLVAADITGKVDKAGDTMTGDLSLTGGSGVGGHFFSRGSTTGIQNSENWDSDGGVTDAHSFWTTSNTSLSTGYPFTTGQTFWVKGASDARSFAFWKSADAGVNNVFLGVRNVGNTAWEWFNLWHEGNDGVGSGLDADLLYGVSKTTSGNRFGVYTTIDGGGAMEIGRYLDFHLTDTETQDYESRLYLDTTDRLSVTSSFRCMGAMYMSANTFATGYIRIATVADVSPSSTTHGFQIGSSSGANIRMDNNEIMAANNGASALLRINRDGGTVAIGDGTAAALTVGSTVTATNFILSSDKRLKKNIKDYEIKPVNIDWKTFDWKEKGKGDNQIGVIAQELEKNHPEFITTDHKGMKAVKYTELLIAKNAELEQRIERLEKMIMNITPSLN